MTSGQARRELKERYLSSLPKASGRRRLIDKLVTFTALGCVILAMIPLGSILIEVFTRGSPIISVEFLTEMPGSFIQGGGGLGPSIQGTLIVVGFASLVAVPLGILTGIYLSEFAGNGWFPSTVRLLNDVLTGMPSIVIGLLAFLTVVLTTGTFSVGAGAFALSIIMTPIVVRVTEESLKLVPNAVREAGHALGVPKWKISMMIILKSAKSGVLTGVVIGIARIAGETAPLIMTILGARYFFDGFASPMDALPLRIFKYGTSPYPEAQAAGWGGALILIIMILTLSVALRFIVERKSGQFKSRNL